jgi:hypothetical protein
MTKPIEKGWGLLCESWKNFSIVIVNPLTVILLLAIFFLIYLSQEQEKNKLLMNIIIIIISIMSGVVGGLITNKWSEITETKIITTRGKLAIRNLGLLLLNMRSLEKRIALYLERLDKKGENNLINTYLEETIEKLNILEEEVINSVENWKDLIPEADLTTQIGVISDLKEKVSTLDGEIQQSKEKVDKIEEESSKEKDELIKKIGEKEKELLSVKSKLQEKEIQILPYFSSTGFSGYSGPSVFTHAEDLVIDMNCVKCGKHFKTPLGGADYTKRICPDCKGRSEKSPEK